MKMTRETSTMVELLLSLVLVRNIEGTIKEGIVLRTFDVVKSVNMADNMAAMSRQQSTSTKMRCISLCTQMGCECTSCVFDVTNQTCYMFDKPLITEGGEHVGYIKQTVCASPHQIADASLVDYTSCSSTYICDNGYKSPPGVSNVITCQEDETWAPSEYACKRYWTVSVFIGTKELSESPETLYMDVVGTLSNADDINLGDNFLNGEIRGLEIGLIDFGIIRHITLYQETTNGIRVQKVIIESGDTYTFTCNCWIDTDDPTAESQPSWLQSPDN